MADEEIVIPNFDLADLQGAMSELGLNPIDESEKKIAEVHPQPPRRRRGRPRKNPLPEPTEVEASLPEKIVEPAKLTKREEREVAERLAKMLTGITGLISIPTRPYFEMTDEEAKDISEPLASYLVRNAETVPIAREVLENYDLALIVLGICAYVVRVYGERRAELASQPANTRNTQRPSLLRISEIQEQTNQRQSNEGEVAETSVEVASRLVASSPVVVPSI